MRVEGEVHTDDTVVEVHDRLYGLMKACCRIGGRMALVLVALELVANDDAMSKLRVSGNYVTAPAAAIGRHAACWYKTRDDELIALW